MPPLAPSVIDQISASMSVSSLQQQVIASNIANRDTQGYQRMKLRFDQALDQAGTATIGADDSNVAVSLEQDLVALSSNSMQYAALARSLSRYLSIISAITNPNRG